MRKVPYLQWENIFLDTTIIFTYINATREGDKASNECKFVKRLIDDLNTNESTNRKKRNFYISSVSIAEMYNKSVDRKKAEIVIEKLNISTMTFVPFDNDIAEHMTSNYHTVLGTEKLNKFAKELGYPEYDYVMAREWITKDLMIVASSDYIQCDTIITLDIKTMVPLCNKIDYHSCHALEQNFNIGSKNIFEYN